MTMMTTTTTTITTVIILGDFNIYMMTHWILWPLSSLSSISLIIMSWPHLSLIHMATPKPSHQQTTSETSTSNITLEEHNLLPSPHTLVLPFQNFYDLIGTSNSLTPMWFFQTTLFSSYPHQDSGNWNWEIGYLRLWIFKGRWLLDVWSEGEADSCYLAWVTGLKNWNRECMLRKKGVNDEFRFGQVESRCLVDSSRHWLYTKVQSQRLGSHQGIGLHYLSFIWQ